MRVGAFALGALGVVLAATACENAGEGEGVADDAGATSSSGTPSGSSSSSSGDASSSGASSSGGSSSGGSSSGEGGSSSSSSGGSSSGGPTGPGVEGTSCDVVGERYERSCGECGVQSAYCLGTRLVSGYGACVEGSCGGSSSGSSSSGGSSSSSGGASSGGSSSSGGLPPECDDGQTRCQQFGEQVCVDKRWQDRAGEACCVDPNPNRFVNAGGDWFTDVGGTGRQFNRQLERRTTGSSAETFCRIDAAPLISRETLLGLALPNADACTPALDHTLFRGHAILGDHDPMLHDVFFVRPPFGSQNYECVSTRTGQTVPCGAEANVMCGN